VRGANQAPPTDEVAEAVRVGLRTATPSVLVTGVGGAAGRSLATQLVARGVHVVGTDIVGVDLPGVTTELVPRADDRRFVPALTKIATQMGADLVIPTVTEELGVLAGVPAGSLGNGAPARIVVGPAAAVRVADDKWRTYERLLTAGVAVPRSWCRPHPVGRHALTDPAVVEAAVGMPAVSKPRVGRGGRGVVVLREPLDIGPDVTAHGRLLQKFVPGTESAVDLYIASHPQSGASVVSGAAVVLEKMALAQGEVGNAVEVRAVDELDVAVLAVRAAGAIGLTGPADVDIRRRRDGVPVVLEINARFGAHSAAAPGVLDALLAEWLPSALTGVRQVA